MTSAASSVSNGTPSARIESTYASRSISTPWSFSRGPTSRPPVRYTTLVSLSASTSAQVAYARLASLT